MKSVLQCYVSPIVYILYRVIYVCDWKCNLKLFVKNNGTDLKNFIYIYIYRIYMQTLEL